MISLIKNKMIKSSVSLIVVLIFNILCTTNFAYSKTFMTDKEVLDLKNEAFALYATDNKDAALELIRQIPSDRRGDEIYTIEANIYEDMHETGRAVENLNKALKINPKSYKVYYNIGCILLNKRSYELALENFKLSIKYNREFAFSRYNLACCYIEKKQYRKAKTQLIKAINLKPDEKDFYLNLAYCYKQLGNKKAAAKILNALEKNQAKT